MRPLYGPLYHPFYPCLTIVFLSLPVYVFVSLYVSTNVRLFVFICFQCNSPQQRLRVCMRFCCVFCMLWSFVPVWIVFCVCVARVSESRVSSAMPGRWSTSSHQASSSPWRRDLFGFLEGETTAGRHFQNFCLLLIFVNVLSFFKN